MKITISGSLGNIGKHLTNQLVSEGHTLTVITSNEERKAAIETLGAAAAIGSVTDTDFLQNAFEGADAVFVMTPPNLGGSNIIANTVEAGKAFAKAITASGVKRVVMLSSIGADQPEGTGPIKGLHHIEKLYNELDGVGVTFLRAGWFYTNFFNDVALIKNMGIMGANYPSDLSIPLVHASDIAAAVSEELLRHSTEKDIRYIVSDVRKPAEFASVIGNAIGKSELPWVEFTDEQSLGGMVQAGLTEEMAGLYTEMGKGFRTGKIPADFQKNGSPVTGKVKLEDFAQAFSKAF